VRIRPEVKALAESVEARMRDADKLIAAGRIIHRNFLERDDLLVGAQRNLQQAERGMRADKPDWLAIVRDLTDCAGYISLLAHTLGRKDSNG